MEAKACPFCGLPTGKKITECGMSESMSHFWCRGGDYNTRTPDLLAEKETHAICCLGGDHKCQLNVNGGYCAATRCQYRVFSQYQKAKG